MRRYRFGSSGNSVGIAAELGGGGRADGGVSGGGAGAKEGLAAGAGAAVFKVVGKIDAGSSAGRIVPKVPCVEEVRCGLVSAGDSWSGAGDGSGWDGGGGASVFKAVGRIGAGSSSAGRIAPKVPCVEEVRCGLVSAGDSWSGAGDGSGWDGGGGVSGSFTPVGISLSGKS